MHHDKHGTPLEQGDLVAFVYGGEHHIAPVTAHSTDEHGIPHVHTAIQVRVPAGTTQLHRRASHHEGKAKK